MQYVQFGETGMKVSRFCLGGMMFSRKLDQDASRLVVDEALDRGVNFIDTAESYGESEEFLGRILDGRRDKVYLATKVYTKWAADGQCGRNSRANILFSLERSLTLLKTDHVDLYQLHHVDYETAVDETLEALDAIVKQGKTRFVGVSNHYAWQMAQMIGESRRRGFDPIVSNQCSYSIVDRPIEIEMVPMAKRFNLALMVYYPLRGGVLTGKYRRGEGVPAGTRAEQDAKLQILLSKPQLWDVLETVDAVAKRNSLAMNQVAMLWVLAKGFVTCPILGGSKPEHFRMMYEIADRKLIDADVKEIDEASKGFAYKPFVNQPIDRGPDLAEQW
jgi:aryl-alcohol dehydrogenase-like predicted oxidoreductase